MEWIRENWIYIAIFAFFIAMNYFGFGCCGGHGRHGGYENAEHKGHSEDEPSEKKEQKGGH